MPIVDKKISAFAKDVSDLSDKPVGMSAAELKAQFDAAPNELRDAFNAVIDILISVATGDSGAENIGTATIPGVTGDTIYEQLVSLKATMDGLVVGQIPDSSLPLSKLDSFTQSKLSSATVYAYKNLGGF